MGAGENKFKVTCVDTRIYTNLTLLNHYQYFESKNKEMYFSLSVKTVVTVKFMELFNYLAHVVNNTISVNVI